MGRGLSRSEKTAITLTAFIIFLLALGLFIGRSLVAGGNHITTTVVAFDTVRDSAEAEGLIIRKEQSLSADSADFCYLICEDGEKVARGDDLALRFSSQSQLDAYRKAARLAERISRLRELQAAAGRDSDLSGVNERLYETLLSLSAAAGEGSADDVFSDRALDCITARDIILDAGFDISARISALEEEYDRMVRVAGGGSFVRAPAAGYYSAAADGYVGRLTYADARNLDTATVISLLKDPPAPAADTAGTLVSGYEWYYAALLSEAETESLREGRTYTLTFPGFDANATLVLLGEPAEGKCLCLFYLNTRMEKAVSLRRVSAEIVFNTVSGYRIPKASLRIDAEGRRGVYVIRGQRCVFMEVEILLEKDSYYVVKADLGDNSGLFLNDTLVLSGKDLYDGMVIN